MGANKSAARTRFLHSKIFKTIIFILLDSMAILLSELLSVIVVHTATGNASHVWVFDMVLPYIILIVLTLCVFWCFQLYHSIWKYAGTEEIIRVVIASVISAIICFIVVTVFGRTLDLGVYILYFAMLFTFTVSSRFYYRIMRFFRRRRTEGERNGTDIRIMLIGAGEGGNMILRQIQSDYGVAKRRVVCVIDDDESKIGRLFRGILVVGGRDLIEKAAEEYKVDEIILAVPSLKYEDRCDILVRCGRTGCKQYILPNIYTVLGRKSGVGSLRSIQIEDLLGRDPIKLEMEVIQSYLNDKCVLVTGGGGSIGSELCRQIAMRNPKLLVIFDIYENTTYELEIELMRNYPGLNFVVVIGSIRDQQRINYIFEKYMPDVVFHAAAHKHVPLMESNPHEAIKNNVFGTLNVVRAAEKSSIDKFVLISSDKAVRPTNVMGVTKRICEMIVQAYSRVSKTSFVAVRFGNVLGSHGSVVPLFREQIACGGPVLVTHPEITRYFMTAPEAVSLVLQAGAYAAGGEIFVLDMGKPVKIVDFAQNMIRLSGYEPGKDIKIEFTGLRPGEKLYEELLLDRESMIKTANELIFIEKPFTIDEKFLFTMLDKLLASIEVENADVRPLLGKIVPEYEYTE